MKNRVLFSFLFLLLLFSFAQSGKQFPKIDIKDFEGKIINTSELYQNSDFTLITFWATWCSPCKKELAAYATQATIWKKKYGLEINTISIDDQESSLKVKQFVSLSDWPFKSYWDVANVLMKQMYVKSIPYTVIVNKSGKIVYEQKSYVEGDELAVEDFLIQNKK